MCKIRAVAILALTLLFLPVPASSEQPNGQLDPSIVVQFENPQAGEHVTGITDIAGFAGDRRAQDGSGLNERDVQIYLDDEESPPQYRNLLAVPGTARNGELDERPGNCCDRELNTALLFRTPWAACTFPAGRHTLTAWVSSLAVPGARQRATVEFATEQCPAAQVLAEHALPVPPFSGLRAAPGESRIAPVPGDLTAVYADFAVGLDFRCSGEGAAACGYGIVFRRIPGPATRQQQYVSDGNYTFLVQPAQHLFLLNHWEPNAPRAIRDPLVRPTQHPAIRDGDNWNRLGVVAEGDRLRLFVNGEQVADLRDGRRPWGDIMWTGESGSNERPVDLAFANVVIAMPGPIEALGPVLQGPAQ